MSGWWIEIEGVKQRFGYGGMSASSSFDDRDDIAGQPDTLSDRCDPMTSELDLSRFSFSVNASQQNVELLLFQQVFGVNRIDGDIEEGAPGDTVTVNFETDHSFEAGDVFYVDLETFVVDDVIDTTTVDAVRGQFGSGALEHVDGVSVYDRVPGWRGRRVELKTDPGERNRWVGYVESIRRPDAGARIIVECRNIWTSIIGTTLGPSGGASLGWTLSPKFQTGAGDNAIGAEGSASVFGGSDFPDVDTGDFHFFQFGDLVLVGEISSEDLGTAGETNLDIGKWAVDFDSPSELDTEFGDGIDGDSDIVGKARPLFVITSRDFSTTFTGRFSATADIDLPDASVISTSDTQYYAHPANIALFLLTSYIIDDDLEAVRLPTRAPSFTLGMGGLYGSGLRDSVADIIELDPDEQVDQFVLGWDGEDYDVVDTIASKLLRPYGYFFGLDQRGFPTIARFNLPTSQEMEEVESVDARVVEPLTHPWQGDYDPGYTDSVDEVTAEMGGLPWVDNPGKIRVQNRGASAGRTRIGDKERWEFDLETVRNDSDSEEEWVERLTRRALLVAFGFPRLTIRAPDAPEGSYGIGGLVRLDKLPVEGDGGGYLISQDGRLVSDVTQGFNQMQFYGLIVSREFIPSSQHYELEVMLTSWRTAAQRFRPPAMIIGEIEEGEIAGNPVDILVPDSEGFFTQLDNNGFDLDEIIDAGDLEIQIADQTLSTKESMDVANIRDDGGIVVADSGSAEVGDIVRLDGYDAGAEFATTGLVAYNFLSDPDGQLSGDDGHEYG